VMSAVARREWSATAPHDGGGWREREGERRFSQGRS
jgi:hypothetical protein